MLQEAIRFCNIKVLGDQHLDALLLKAKKARLWLAHGLSSGPELLRAVVANMEAVAGAAHPQTVKYAAVLAET